MDVDTNDIISANRTLLWGRMRVLSVSRDYPRIPRNLSIISTKLLRSVMIGFDCEQ